MYHHSEMLWYAIVVTFVTFALIVCSFRMKFTSLAEICSISFDPNNLSLVCRGHQLVHAFVSLVVPSDSLPDNLDRENEEMTPGNPVVRVPFE
jgi:hypothetical protein